MWMKYNETIRDNARMVRDSARPAETSWLVSMLPMLIVLVGWAFSCGGS